MFEIFRVFYKEKLSHPLQGAVALLFLVVFLLIYLWGNSIFPILASLIILYLVLHLQMAMAHKLRFNKAVARYLSLAVFILLWLALISIFPSLSAQVSKIIPSINEFFTKINLNFLPSQLPYIAELGVGEKADEVFRNAMASIGDSIKEIFADSLVYFNRLITFTSWLAIIPVLVIFLFIDWPEVSNWFKTQAFTTNLKPFSLFFEKIDLVTLKYVQGKIIEAVIIGFSNYLLFVFFAVPYSEILSFIVGISVFLPFVGIFIVSVPVIALMLLSFSGNELLILLGLYIFIQLLDGYLLVPILFGSIFAMPSGIIMLAIVVFGIAFGLWGVFFAVPLLVFLKTFYQNWPSRSALGTKK